MKKLKIKYFLEQIDSHVLEEIAEKISEHTGDDDLDFAEPDAGIDYITNKVVSKPCLTQLELDRLSEPFIMLIAMNKFYEQATLIQSQVNKDLHTKIDCIFPTLHGDTYCELTDSIAEVLINHLK